MTDSREFGELDAHLADLAEPIAPPERLKGEVLASIKNTPQLTPEKDADAVPIERRRTQRTARKLMAAAAAVLLVVGAGTVWVGTRGSDEQTAPNQTISAGEPMQGAAATDKMHEIMAAPDVRSVTLQADDSQLDIVVSSDMNSGGAMVNGAPELARGMGAQVWAIDAHGNARSAGVIGQEAHNDVWMPLPADTMSVRVTEEPMAGSPRPEGTVLAEGAL